jgi:hypothetical protein
MDLRIVSQVRTRCVDNFDSQSRIDNLHQDVLIHEAPLIRNLSSGNGLMTMIDGAELRCALRLERDSYVDLALLCGTDFNQRIPGVGPWRALELIRRHHRIERILEMEPRYASKINPLSFMSDIEGARSIFTSQLPIPSPAECEQKETNDQLVLSILHQFGAAEVMEGYRNKLQMDGCFASATEFDLNGDYWRGVDTLERV